MDETLKLVLAENTKWAGTLAAGHTAIVVVGLSYIRERALFHTATNQEMAYVHVLADNATPFSMRARKSIAKEHLRGKKMQKVVEKMCVGFFDACERLSGRNTHSSDNFPTIALLRQFYKDWSKMVMLTKGFLADHVEAAIYTSILFLESVLDGVCAQSLKKGVKVVSLQGLNLEIWRV